MKKFFQLPHVFAKPARAKGTLGLIAIMKNEALNIREWVDHYKWQGVDKIFLIDNASNDNAKDLIRHEIEVGFIEYFSKPKSHQQTRHYRDVYRAARIRQKAEWLVVADLDEFWFSLEGNLKQAVSKIEDEIDLVYTNWTTFGSCGHTKHPNSLRKELCLRHERLGSARNTKWICRTASVKSPRALSIHKVRGIDSRKVISDNETLKLYHYVTQSEHYFKEVKMKRGDASNRNADAIRTMRYFEECNSKAIVNDETLANKIRAYEEQMRRA